MSVKFKVGDRVRVVDSIVPRNLIGLFGTVKVIISGYPRIGVDFGIEKIGDYGFLHDLDGILPGNSGYYLDDSNLVLLEGKVKPKLKYKEINGVITL